MEYEYERQVDLIESGCKVVQETLRYDDAMAVQMQVWHLVLVSSADLQSVFPDYSRVNARQQPQTLSEQPVKVLQTTLS